MSVFKPVLWFVFFFFAFVKTSFFFEAGPSIRLDPLTRSRLPVQSHWHAQLCCYIPAWRRVWTPCHTPSLSLKMRSCEKSNTVDFKQMKKKLPEQLTFWCSHHLIAVCYSLPPRCSMHVLASPTVSAIYRRVGLTWTWRYTDGMMYIDVNN